MTGKKDNEHESTWRDHVDESGRFFTCKGSEGPQPLAADDNQEAEEH